MASEVSLDIHLHMLFVDGVYRCDEERSRLHRGSVRPSLNSSACCAPSPPASPSPSKGRVC